MAVCGRDVAGGTKPEAASRNGSRIERSARPFPDCLCHLGASYRQFFDCFRPRDLNVTGRILSMSAVEWYPMVYSTKGLWFFLPERQTGNSLGQRPRNRGARRLHPERVAGTKPFPNAFAEPTRAAPLQGATGGPHGFLGRCPRLFSCSPTGCGCILTLFCPGRLSARRTAGSSLPPALAGGVRALRGETSALQRGFSTRLQPFVGSCVKMHPQAACRPGFCLRTKCVGFLTVEPGPFAPTNPRCAQRRRPKHSPVDKRRIAPYAALSKLLAVQVCGRSRAAAPAKCALHRPKEEFR